MVDEIFLEGLLEKASESGRMCGIMSDGVAES